MELKIRKETQSDYNEVEMIIRFAFEAIEHSDHKEHLLVARLRKSDAFIPELSLVAECDGMIVGHILLTRLIIQNDNEVFESLALAPVSIKPEYQRKGIGSALIFESHKIAKQLGYKSIILLGHKEYYPRFGYEPTTKYNIRSPFKVPDENFMVKSLEKNAMNGISGIVKYPKEFFE